MKLSDKTQYACRARLGIFVWIQLTSHLGDARLLRSFLWTNITTIQFDTEEQ